MVNLGTPVYSVHLSSVPTFGQSLECSLYPGLTVYCFSNIIVLTNKYIFYMEKGDVTLEGTNEPQTLGL